MAAREVNFDGLVGPTHNYAGLSYGNVASAENARRPSSPRRAAHEGLKKMAHLAALGVPQAVLAPQARPDVELLRRLGFTGRDTDVLDAAGKRAPALLAAACSASSMWTANAATVSPSADSLDGRVHFTPANLVNKLHRAIEAETTSRILRAVFPDDRRFAHHAPLPASDALGDEGAANHTRFCGDFGAPGVQLFVFGKSALDPQAPRPREFPARHTREASEAIARLHQVPADRAIFAQQSPDVIDAGVFHNDVIAVGHQHLLLHHQRAFLEGDAVLSRLNQATQSVFGRSLHVLTATEAELPVLDAVRSYLFNSQIVTLPNGAMALIAPREVEETPRARAFVERVLAEGGPITRVDYLDLRQSMHNGGGPACLRLRVVLTDDELTFVNRATWVDAGLLSNLASWVDRHYRDQLAPEDLVDPALLEESRRALDELTQILCLGSVYEFQRTA